MIEGMVDQLLDQMDTWRWDPHLVVIGDQTAFSSNHAINGPEHVQSLVERFDPPTFMLLTPYL